ncbi:MAG: hypothetical protein ACYDA8_14145 [Deferrisomatales bacterium]
MNPIVGWIDRLRAHPQALRAGFFALLGMIVVYDVFASRHEPHFFGDNVRGFWAVFGLVGCVFLGRFMKGIGHAWLMKPLDFYRKKEEG